METIKKAKKSQAFNKGWMQVAQKDASLVKEEIMQELGIVSYPTWKSRLYGRVSPTVDEVIKIESVFKKYGVKDIWGED